MIWMTIRKYWSLVYGLLMSVGGSLLTWLLLNSRKNRKNAKEAKARLEHARNVMNQDREIEREHDVRTEEIAKDLKDKKSTDELSDPNDW